MRNHKYLTGMLALALCFISGLAAAQDGQGIAPGTVINMKNWKSYQQYMPDGMKILFEGKYFWKFPADFEMVIGQTHHYSFPRSYTQDTEKYSRLVKITDSPSGEHLLTGYVAGLPFPSPSGNYKGWEMLANLWFAYEPYVYCNPDTWLYFLDRFHNMSQESFVQVYRKFDHVSDPGQPINNSKFHGIDYTEYLQVTKPEQAKYTAQLTVYYSDPTKFEDLFLFVPSLRRVLRLSSAARCSPVVGSDYTQDEARNTLFNSSISRFDATFLRDQKVLAITQSPPGVYGNVANYYPAILFPKPAVGKWEARDAHVIDVRRVPSQRQGYCFGKKIMYLDAEAYTTLWEDLYDAGMKLWKVAAEAPIAGQVPGEGEVLMVGNQWNIMIDLQNAHLTMYDTSNAQGVDFKANQQCRNYQGVDYTNADRYASVSGLSLIMR
ncbi:MAG: DUF1329 domain-containing protein [Candidatus Binataceae bacterium]